mgnify:CR=1 FL=1
MGHSSPERVRISLKAQYALKAIFDQFQPNGQVAVEYAMLVYYGQFVERTVSSPVTSELTVRSTKLVYFHPSGCCHYMMSGMKIGHHVRATLHCSIGHEQAHSLCQIKPESVQAGRPYIFIHQGVGKA